MKRNILMGFLGLVTASHLMADANVCDGAKIDNMFKMAIDQGASILKKEASLDLAGNCEVYVSFNGKIDLTYADLEKNQFIAGGTMISYSPETKQYAPKNMSKISNVMQEIENENYAKAMDYLKDDKKLNEYFALSKPTYSKKDEKNYVNKKYDILIFESLQCHFCQELNGMLASNFADKNIKTFNYYLPLNQDDYNNLKSGYYKDEETLKKAIALKEELKLMGVPIVLVRDSKTKKIVDIFRSPTSPVVFEKMKKYFN